MYIDFINWNQRCHSIHVHKKTSLEFEMTEGIPQSELILTKGTKGLNR